MRILLLWTVAACALATATRAERGGSLRGALEALQRRQRGRMHGPPDYEALYEAVLPPQAYADPEYELDLEEVEDEPNPKYIVKLLDGNERPAEAYEYKVIKKNSAYNNPNHSNRKQSAFRERTQHSDNDKLRELFLDSNDIEEKENIVPEKIENDAEYAQLLGQLWSKYKANKAHNRENAPQGVVKLYKDKMVKKSYPDSWGPIAFKRKRSSDIDTEKPEAIEYEVGKSRGDEVAPINQNYNSYDTDNDKDDMHEEYAIAFQPLDDDTLTDLVDEDQYAYDALEKRFPVSKRSSEPYVYGTPKKRFALERNNENSKSFRSSAGTDPRIIQDLSKIFGEPEVAIIKTPVKRSSDYQSESHEILPPNLTAMHHNTTDDHHNHTISEEHSHEHQGHNMHPPNISGKEAVSEHEEHKHNDDHEHHNHNHNHHDHSGMQQKTTEKPIVLKKKSIDWSDYFGIDKRRKKSAGFVNNLNEDRLKKQYFDTFNKEVVYPLNSFRKHSYVKRNYVQNAQAEMMNNEKSLAIRDEKRTTESDSAAKLDNIDKKLKNMEGLIVDEALHYTNIGEDLDSKEEQEMKEKLLSRLAAAYSLEKMRKALKEFKQSLQVQKTLPTRAVPEIGESKDKKVAVKKEKALMTNEIPNFSKSSDRSDDFEDEQGAGHYLNGKIEEQLSEGYMGGSGRHRVPVMSTASSPGSCPVLAKIIERCRGVDLLAGDRGQLFLPLCSLHQICYLCSEAPPTTCDLVFLSEADSACEGDMSCGRAARSALMALRELHDGLADELDGECEASPCLQRTLKLNLGWQALR